MVAKTQPLGYAEVGKEAMAMTLGQRIQELRKQTGLSQEALGEALGVSRQAVSKWERDESQPDIATLKKLADIYGVSVLEIIEPGRRSEPKKNEEEAPAPTPVTEEKQDDSELIAVITAAVAAAMGRSTSGLVVRSYKNVSGDAWNRAGRLDVLENRL